MGRGSTQAANWRHDTERLARLDAIGRSESRTNRTSALKLQPLPVPRPLRRRPGRDGVAVLANLETDLAMRVCPACVVPRVPAGRLPAPGCDRDVSWARTSVAKLPGRRSSVMTATGCSDERVSGGV
jgi:hypothetical protein